MTTESIRPDSWLARRAPTTVAVFRALQVGDMLCSVPALRSLRAALPHARISLVGLPWSEQFVARFASYLDEFIPFPGHADFPEQLPRDELIHDFYAAMRARRFDLAIQLHGAGPQSNDVVRAFAARATAGFGECGLGARDFFIPFPHSGTEASRLLSLTHAMGAQSTGTSLEFPITQDDVQELANCPHASSLVATPYMCVHPGARKRDKCWHPARFAKVADSLAHDFRLQVVLTGSAAEADLTSRVARHMHHRPIDTASGMSLGAMAALIKNARLILANDTGVSHIAAALRVPSVIVFHGADMHRWAPSDKLLHRCLHDPEGERVDDVIVHARALLSHPAAFPQAPTSPPSPLHDR